MSLRPKTLRRLTATTAATTVLLGTLSLAVPAAAQGLLLSPEGAVSDPTRMPSCPAAAQPVCPDGAPLNLGAVLERLTAEGDLGAVAQALAGEAPEALCSDGTEALCPDGSAAAFAPPEVSAEAPDMAPAVAPEAGAEAQADATVADPEPAPEPLADTAQTTAEPAADPAGVQALADALARIGSPEQAIAEQPAADAGASGGLVGGPTDPRDGGQPIRLPEGSADSAAVLQVLNGLLGQGQAADGEAGAPLAALEPQADAPATQTVETQITADDTRQSDEDFATDAAGRPAEQTPGQTPDDSNRDMERLALLGLGALAVGAILSNGDEVVSNTGDRVVLRRGTDDFYVLRDDDAVLRRPGSLVRTERFDDGSTRSFVTREDGSVIITVRDASGRVVLREREGTDGTRVVLIDDTAEVQPVTVTTLPRADRREVVLDQAGDAAALRAALDLATARGLDRTFSLRQVRDIPEVRKLVPEIAVRPITFQTGSAAIRPTEAQALSDLGIVMARLIEDDPREVFLIEGHTDAVGGAAYNLALSDRRAESVALALTEYFGIPPENLVVQGYGFTDLLVPTRLAEEQNRRVAVRRISPLLIDRLTLR